LHGLSWFFQNFLSFLRKKRFWTFLGAVIRVAFGQGSEQHDLVEDVLALCRGVRLDGL